MKFENSLKIKKIEFKHVGQSQSYGPGQMAKKKLLKRNDWPHISREVQISFGTSNDENNKNLTDRFLKHTSEKTSIEDFDRTTDANVSREETWLGFLELDWGWKSQWRLITLIYIANATKLV